MRGLSGLSLAFVLLGLGGRVAGAQAPPRNEIAVHVEPVAGGIRYARRLAPGIKLGPALTVGPFEGITLRRGIAAGDLDTWATLYATLGFRPAPAFEVLLSPIGAALALGDDFSSPYPSGQAGIQAIFRRVTVGSDLRVIRIAGTNGTGHYWIQWIPVRVGLRWTW
ncbi:MAG: hypothetical protein ACRENB_00790 [Gemmatimonadales bacterium]